jgi:pimeloyl-ACP methyl ester carboxylesterase
MGGTIAQSLAYRHPRLVRRLVLCATAPGNRRATPPAAGVISQLAAGTANAFRLLFPPRHDSAGQAYINAITSYPNAGPGAPPEVARAQLAARHLVGRTRSVGTSASPAPAAGARGR